MIKIGMTGATVIGDVLDVARKPLEDAIKRYDSQLYLKWNPKKRQGRGIWELRRRPDQKSVIETIELNGIKYHRLDYKELDVVNHIFDFEYLGYHILEKIKKSDTWLASDYDGYNTDKTSHFLDRMDSVRESYDNKIKQDADDQLAYELRYYKSAFRDFKESILSGINPADIAHYWDK